MLFHVNTILSDFCRCFHVYHTNWHYTVTQILANKIVITTFSLVPVKYGINHTAAMGIFVRAVKQVWYYGSYLVIYTKWKGIIHYSNCIATYVN